jgi:hypothetical protein
MGRPVVGRPVFVLRTALFRGVFGSMGQGGAQVDGGTAGEGVATSPTQATGPTSSAKPASMRERAVPGRSGWCSRSATGRASGWWGTSDLAFLLRDNIAAIGIMALVNSLNRGCRWRRDVGLNLSVVQHERGEDPTVSEHGVDAAGDPGWLLFLVCCAVAVPYAGFFGEPVLAWLVPFTGLVLVAVAVQSPGVLIAERRVEVWREDRAGCGGADGDAGDDAGVGADFANGVGDGGGCGCGRRCSGDELVRHAPAVGPGCGSSARRAGRCWASAAGCWSGRC